jgi:hypothetical protein
MFHELCMAILPSHRLAQTFSTWDEIVQRLAEPPRKRLRHAYY